MRQIPNTNVIPQAKHVCGPIGFAPYAVPGSEALGESIADVFAKGHDAVVMENHGVVVGGKNLIDAFERFEAMEFCSRTIINAKTIGEPKLLSDADIKEFDAQIPTLLPELDSVSYPSDERFVRDEIVRIVRRACKQGLMIRHLRYSFGALERKRLFNYAN